MQKQTVNLLTYVFIGSNPILPTIITLKGLRGKQRGENSSEFSSGTVLGQ